jgi:bifunctional non-homologous end joining protein LigD
MPLAKYRKMRNFSRTAEPRGRSRRRAGNSFVVQKHAARALHYDFRLELDGVLLSWAVPKGPSLNPKVKRLAMQTEDHPVEYGTFEGTIPNGEYGAGEVIVWDAGTWTPEGDPRRAYREGRLTFRLDGEKLHGGFHLVRTAAGKDARKRWLLFKATDAEARSNGDAEIVDARPESILSGKGVEKEKRERRPAARPAKKKAAKTAGPRTTMPKFIEPELATLVDAAPEGDDYLHEIKLDGYRIVAAIADGRVVLWSRRGNDWSSRLPSVVRGVEALGIESGILDGEVVVFEDDGKTNFQRLQNSIHAGKESVCTYVVFDAPFLDGVDLRGSALLERKKVLAARLTKKALGRGPVRLSDYIVGNGKAFFRESCRLGLEGIVSKRVDAKYESKRSRAWVKVKCSSRQEFVIGGFTEPNGARGHFGALLVGVQEKGGLRYAGKVGTGFTSESLQEIKRKLARLERPEPPFANPPRGADARGVHWLAPELVAEVQFAEQTKDGILRHASFQGLREDKPAREVHAERAEVPAERAQQAQRGIDAPHVTHPDRILYPEQGITKGELSLYYSKVASWMLPHLTERPLVLVRCPEGVAKQCFFQKHPSKGTPEAVDRVPIAEKKGTKDYMVVHDAEGLIGLVQLGALEIHTWGSHIDTVEKPDQLVFDLDPDVGLPWARVIEAAKELRSILTHVGLTGFLKTTGGKGLHVVVPIEPEVPWDEAKAFCKAMVDTMASKSPGRYVTTMTKEKRKGKLFLDYLRNARGATAICAYSTRARAGAPVALPIDWKELEAGAQPEQFDVRSVPARLAALKKDPWETFEDARASISSIASAGRSKRKTR